MSLVVIDEHLHTLKRVLERVRLAKLKLKPSKCKVVKRELQFLGHIVSSKGISVCTDKIDGVTTWPFPKDKHELRAFLGFAGYYHHFIQAFSTKAAGLTHMLRKDIPVQRNPAALESFEYLKKALTEMPVLALSRDEGANTIDCDASNVGCGSGPQSDGSR